MSISRGKFVATFDRPGDKFRWFEGTRRCWRVWIKIRRRPRGPLISIDDNATQAFSNFEEAKRWAIARLRELEPLRG